MSKLSSEPEVNLFIWIPLNQRWTQNASLSLNSHTRLHSGWKWDMQEGGNSFSHYVLFLMLKIALISRRCCAPQGLISLLEKERHLWLETCLWNIHFQPSSKPATAGVTGRCWKSKKLAFGVGRWNRIGEDIEVVDHVVDPNGRPWERMGIAATDTMKYYHTSWTWKFKMGWLGFVPVSSMRPTLWEQNLEKNQCRSWAYPTKAMNSSLQVEFGELP